MIEIKNWKTGEIIYSGDFASIKACLENGVKKDICFTYAKLNDAELNGAKLNGAELKHAKLNGAELNDAILNRAELKHAELNYANLNGAKLNDAELNGAELNGAIGLLNQKTWLHENFTTTKQGFIVYKVINNTLFKIPSYWEIKEENYIEEEVNFCRSNPCGCGVNFGTLEYVKANFSDSNIWECSIEWEDLINVVVPYNTNGKARCARLKLIRKMELNNG